MPVRIPPLQALQAFEAAARHQSYTRAAQELKLTHSAISHHVALLEGRLGLTLFRRARGRMQLTEDGRILVVRVRQALHMLERAFAKPGAAAATTLNLSVLPSLAACWLVPRLQDFIAEQPDIDLCVQPTTQLADFATDGVDVAIRYGIGAWPELQQQRFMDDAFFPVCSPAYRGGLLPRAPEELSGCTLLRNPWQPWETWFHAAGLALPEPSRGPIYTDAALLLDAAARGQGVALARRRLAEAAIEDGRLVRLFDIAVPDPQAYFLVWRADARKLEAIGALRAWLARQAAAASPPARRKL